MVREAAAFFIEQILLYPDADSYRVLGARPGATYGELRRNMALLLRWLHPDLDPHGERTVFAARVTRAWNDLKTEERRAAYDRSCAIALAEKSLLRTKSGARSKPSGQGRSQRRYNGRSHGTRITSRRPLYLYADERTGFLRRVLLLLFGRAVL